MNASPRTFTPAHYATRPATPAECHGMDLCNGWAWTVTADNGARAAFFADSKEHAEQVAFVLNAERRCGALTI